MRSPPGLASAAGPSNAAPARVGLASGPAEIASDPVGLAPAIASGAIREQDLIAVLTEMCRCLLIARRKQMESACSMSSSSAPEPGGPAAFKGPSSLDGDD